MINKKEKHMMILLISILFFSIGLNNYKNIASNHLKVTFSKTKIKNNSNVPDPMNSGSDFGKNWMKRYSSGIHFEFNPPK